LGFSISLLKPDQPEIEELPVAEVFLESHLTERNPAQNGRELRVLVVELADLHLATLDALPSERTLPTHASRKDSVDFFGRIQKAPGQPMEFVTKNVFPVPKKCPDAEPVACRIVRLHTFLKDDRSTLKSGCKLHMIPYRRKSLSGRMKLHEDR
jgi:hypothetical protein